MRYLFMSSFTQFVHPSRCSRSRTTVCFCSCFCSCSCFCFCSFFWMGASVQPSIPLHLHRSKPLRVHTISVYVRTTSAYLPMRARPEPADFAPDPSLARHHHLEMECGTMACGIPILQFERCCSTEATIGFVLRIVATFASFFSFLILTSSSRTCSRTQNVSRISVFPLLYCFPLIRRQILHSSNIQSGPALNRRFRFRSVVPNLCTNSHETTGQMFRLFSKIQPVLVQQIHALLRQSHSESNSVFLLPSSV